MLDNVHLKAKIFSYCQYLYREDIKFIEGKVYQNQKPLKYFWYKDQLNGSLIKVGYSNWLDFTGSLPKLIYKQNYSNLSYSHLLIAIENLSNSLQKHPIELSISSFEYGLCIPMILDLKALELTDLALNYNSKFFENMDDKSKEPSIGKKCKLQQYQLKLYSKSMQYNLPYELLRFEVKTHRLNYLRKAKIFTLEDLKDKQKLVFLKQDLLKRISNITFYDNSLLISDLKQSEKDLCLNWKSELYRKELVKNDLKKFHYEKHKLIKIISNYGKQNILPTLKNQISNTWDELLES
jgi:hypothetical protein